MVTVITNTRVIQTMDPVEVLEGVDVVIQNDRIKAVGKNAGAAVKADKVISGDGKTVIPGMVCGHHHYYSGLSRAMLISA
ncbi:MAG: chlorohydrolase, partial [Spirochaetales bacterium]|nr:chlorohydrolase [Spirochaetales bacterium]